MPPADRPPPRAPHDTLHDCLAPLAALGPALYLQLGRAEPGPVIIGVHLTAHPAPPCLDRALVGTPVATLGWRPSSMHPFDAPDLRRVAGLDHRNHEVWGGLISAGEQVFGWLGLLGPPPGGATAAWAAAREAVLAVEAQARRLPTAPATLLLTRGGEVALGAGATAAWAAVPELRPELARLHADPSVAGALRAARVACEARLMRGAAGDHLLVDLRAIPPLAAPVAAQLSTVQAAVAEYAAAGATVGEIAATIHRSPETVRTHLKRVYKTLGVSSRVELAAALGQDWP
ncbi:MAG: helix-turn-helix transcriptional regulator [Deltaproteobacteria bacterium]|nr:helix-turn-helix transcriptional regulator [Deltaproteobacteria bacterium]